MGEIAEWILEGGLCQGCGEYLGDGDGYPTYCASCLAQVERPAIKTLKVACSVCGRKVKDTGLHDHMRDKHGRYSSDAESRS